MGIDERSDDDISYEVVDNGVMMPICIDYNTKNAEGMYGAYNCGVFTNGKEYVEISAQRKFYKDCPIEELEYKRTVYMMGRPSYENPEIY